jgi:hypothetical protein
VRSSAKRTPGEIGGGQREQLVDKQAEQSLIESIAKMAATLAADAETGPIKQIPQAKYKPVTPFNPKGLQEHERPSLKRKSYMGGFKLKEHNMTDNEIRLFNRLKGGRYHDNRWTVIETDDSVTLMFPSKTPEDKMQLSKEVRNLEDLLQKILDEANPPAKHRDVPVD